MAHPMLSLHDPLPPIQEENRLENQIIEVDAGPGFQRAAALFRQSVDERVDPCEGEFYTKK
jgi:hypothetical protein